MVEVRVVEVVSEPVGFFLSVVGGGFGGDGRRTGDDQSVAFAPELGLGEALARLGVLGVEEVVEEVFAVGFPHVALGALANLLPAEGEVLVAVLVDLAEQDPVET